MAYIKTQQTFLVFQEVLKTSWRRLQCNNFSSSKSSSRRLQDVFGKCLLKTSSRLLEGVVKVYSKTFSRRVCKTSYVLFKKMSCNHILNTSSRHLDREKNVIPKTSWRHKRNGFLEKERISIKEMTSTKKSDSL